MSDQQTGEQRQPFADKLARAKAKGVTLATRIHLPEAAAASFRLDGVERALRRLDIPVRVLTSQPPADGPKPEDPQGVSVSRWPVLRDKSGYLRGYVPYMSFDLPLFGRLLAAKKPSVLLVEPPPTTGVVVRAVTTLRRIPYVWYAPDVWSDATVSTGVSPAVAKAVQLMESFAMRGAKAVIAVNDGVAIRARQLGARRVEVVNNGIDTDRFTPVYGHIGAAHGVTGPYFIYAGTASEWQGADIFMEAFKQVRAQHPQAQLVFIGKGSHWPVLTELAEQNINGVAISSDASKLLSTVIEGNQKKYPELGVFGLSGNMLAGKPAATSPEVARDHKTKLVLGDWSQLLLGFAGVAEWRVHTAGDFDNTGKDLAGHNQIGIRMELPFGFQILDTKAFAVVKAA